MHIFSKNPEPIQRPNRVYVETSALNFMHSKSPDISGAIATKTVQLAKGNILYTSPVVIWELLLISDDKLREHMIDYCANLCDEMLPKSPGELLLDSILAKGAHVTYDDFSTSSQIGKAWMDIHLLPNRTIEFNKEDLKSMSDSIKTKSKRLDSIIENIILTSELEQENKSLNVLINLVYDKIKYPNNYVPDGHVVARKIAILILFLIVCETAGLGEDKVDGYWHKLNIEHPFDRLMYLAKYYPTAFYSGPVTFMGAVVSYQRVNGKTNRGAIHDGMHMGYLPYFDLFLTDDKILANMQLDAKPIYYDQYSKVRQISNLEYTMREIKIDRPHPLL